MGRPRIQLDIAEVERLAGLGLTEHEIAASLGVNYTTLLDRKKTLSEFSEALKRGKIKAVTEVSNAMYNAAMDGNITAQIFFLKNRARDQWKDKWDVEHSGGTEQTIMVVDTGCGLVGPDAKDTDIAGS